MGRGVFLVLASVAAGCAQGASAEGGGGPFEADNELVEPPTAASMSMPWSGGDARVIVARGAGPALYGCRKGAFCEDFEEAAPATRWTASLTTAGTLDFTGPSSSPGAHALRAMTTGPGSAAYLTLAGSNLSRRWVGALGVSLRVGTPPVGSLGGPELVVTGAAGARTRIGFSVHPAGIKLDQSFESCSGEVCASRSDLVAPGSPDWRHLVVAIETFDASAPPYGRIEVTVDGGDLIVLPLTVTPFDGPVEVHAGITAGDVAPATARVDDVLFYTR